MYYVCRSVCVRPCVCERMRLQYVCVYVYADAYSQGRADNRAASESPTPTVICQIVGTLVCTSRAFERPHSRKRAARPGTAASEPARLATRCRQARVGSFQLLLSSTAHPDR